MVADLPPPELRDRIEPLPSTADPGPEADQTPHAGAVLPEVAAALAEIEAMLAKANPADEENPDDHRQLLDDLDRQIAWLARWIEAKSESVEELVGLEIPDTAWRMVQEAADDEPLFIGIAGRMDSRAAIELREAIGLRLSRQDLIDGDRA